MESPDLRWKRRVWTRDGGSGTWRILRPNPRSAPQPRQARRTHPLPSAPEEASLQLTSASVPASGNDETAKTLPRPLLEKEKCRRIKVLQRRIFLLMAWSGWHTMAISSRVSLASYSRVRLHLICSQSRMCLHNNELLCRLALG